MGSYRKAMMVGFVCRLCAAQKKNVLHVYSQKAKEIDVLLKIKMLPIVVEKYDNLPKTVCYACLENLHQLYLFKKNVHKNCLDTCTRRDGMGGNCYLVNVSPLSMENSSHPSSAESSPDSLATVISPPNSPPAEIFNEDSD